MRWLVSVGADYKYILPVSGSTVSDWAWCGTVRSVAVVHLQDGQGLAELACGAGKLDLLQYLVDELGLTIRPVVCACCQCMRRPDDLSQQRDCVPLTVAKQGAVCCC